jgi:hypothetical protein
MQYFQWFSNKKCPFHAFLRFIQYNSNQLNSNDQILTTIICWVKLKYWSFGIGAYLIIGIWNLVIAASTMRFMLQISLI